MDNHLCNNIYILIPVHNRRETTLTGLARLYQTDDFDRCHIIVIDDGSTDGTAEAVQAQYPSVTLLHGDGQLWWTGAIEKGMRYAQQQGASHYIWLNDDCLVPAGTLRNLVTFVDEHPQSIIGAQGYTDSTHAQLAFGGKHLRRGYYDFFECPNGQTAPCDMLSGNLVCIPKTVVETIGLPKATLPHYGGDTLYLIQARKAGFSLWVDARTVPIDIPGVSALQPTSWMLMEGEPLKIFKLIFQLQSILSWQVWWVLLTIDHGAWGAILFLAKYLWLLPKLLVITGLRLLPASTRQQVMTIKRRIIA